MARAYYNEFDANAAAWLRELIKDGLIAPGDVDERSIVDVQASNLAGYTQCHFFSGIGGWSAALRLAGWPDDERAWTGSCPCQPFSAAGKRKGTDDERHLWPAFFRLIAECQPEWVFGEQVEAAIRHGWLDGISTDLEGKGYSVGAIVLGAHSVGAPHIRQRLYWGAARMADAGGERCSGKRLLLQQRGQKQDRSETPRRSTISGLRDANDAGLSQRIGNGRIQREAMESHQGKATFGGSDHDFWSNYRIVHCRDGKARRIPAPQSGFQSVADGLSAGVDGVRIACADRFPLAGKIPNRVGLLKGAGNAIVPQVAAVFVRAFAESVYGG